MNQTTRQFYLNQNIPIISSPNNVNQFQKKQVLSRHISLPNFVFITNPIQNNIPLQIGNPLLTQNNNINVAPINNNIPVQITTPFLYQNNNIKVNQIKNNIPIQIGNPLLREKNNNIINSPNISQMHFPPKNLILFQNNRPLTSQNKNFTSFNNTPNIIMKF